MKFKYLLLLLLFVPIRVNASLNVNLNCPSSASPSEKVTCNLTGISSENMINGISAKYEFNGLLFNGFNPSSDFPMVLINSSDGFSIGNVNGVNINGIIGSISVTIPSDAKSNDKYKLSIVNFSVSDVLYNDILVNDIGSIIRVKSSINTLSNLSVSGIDFGFSSDKNKYDITTELSEVIITAIKDDENSSVSGNTGKINLNYGVNNLVVSVTSETGIRNDYVINITRIDKRSNVSSLSKLTVSNSNINFKENVTNYNISVDNSVDNINITGILKDSKSKFIPGYEPGNQKLNVGNNKIEIKVQAENGEITTYTINVNRKGAKKEEKSNNNYLSSIKLSVGEINFSKDQTEYKITIENDVNDIDIEAESEDSKSNITISGNKGLKTGENTITIKVQAEDNSIREYKITVIKKNKDNILSSNNYLKELKVENYNIKFNKNTLNYELKILNEKKLNITATAEDTKSKVTITGNNNLENNSIIKIFVVSQDGITRLYEINIIKDTKSNNIKLISIGVLITTIIILFIKLIYNKKKMKEQ